MTRQEFVRSNEGGWGRENAMLFHDQEHQGPIDMNKSLSRTAQETAVEEEQQNNVLSLPVRATRAGICRIAHNLDCA